MHVNVFVSFVPLLKVLVRLSTSLPLPSSPRTVVGFGPKQRCMGQSAKNQQIFNARNTLYDFKQVRNDPVLSQTISLLVLVTIGICLADSPLHSPLHQFIGLSYSDPVVQREKDRVTYDLVELPGDRLGLGVEFLGERQVFSSEQVAAMMLTYLKITTEKAIGKPVKDCVIGVSYSMQV